MILMEHLMGENVLLENKPPVISFISEELEKIWLF